jgi:predicted glycoside hydrolase/deacetylase ChbG (UPF0249 family)
MRRVVFVADDLGISAGVDDGIAAAARAGIVREASLCVTGSSAKAAVRMAKELGIGVGLHLSFTLGRALIGPIRGLTRPDGSFKDLGPALFACMRRGVDAAAVAREVTAQLQALVDLGVQPTHCNGHHHVHCWPVVRDVVFAAAARAGIRWSRLPAEHPAMGGRLQPQRLVLARLAARARSRMAAAGMQALPFVGIALEGRTDHARRFAAAVARLPAGDCEWMVHPRVPDDAFAALDPRGRALEPSARAELATLTSAATRELLAASGIEPVAFAALR